MAALQFSTLTCYLLKFTDSFWRSREGADLPTRAQRKWGRLEAESSAHSPRSRAVIWTAGAGHCGNSARKALVTFLWGQRHDLSNTLGPCWPRAGQGAWKQWLREWGRLETHELPGLADFHTGARRSAGTGLGPVRQLVADAGLGFSDLWSKFPNVSLNISSISGLP